jgi:hypothetical protein
MWHAWREEILMGKPEGDNFKDLERDKRIIFKWIPKKYNGRLWTGDI